MTRIHNSNQLHIRHVEFRGILQYLYEYRTLFSAELRWKHLKLQYIALCSYGEIALARIEDARVIE